MVSARDESDVAPPHASGAVQPLVVGVTGHRDLLPEEVPGIEAAVRSLLADLAERFPDRPLKVMSPLAEGADRIVALIAEELGIELSVPLPMPENVYAQDFESSRSWAEFGRLLRYAGEQTTLPLAPGNTETSISDHGVERNRQYAEVGAWLAARCDVLIAIWDGKMLDNLGGTGHIVRFRRDGEMPGYLPHASGRPERNIVFHIACSRNRADGGPADGLKPLQTRWLGPGGEVHEKFPAAWGERLEATADDALEAAPQPEKSASYSFSYRLPLVIGVTGHRDLRADQLPRYVSASAHYSLTSRSATPLASFACSHRWQKAPTGSLPTSP